MTRLVPAQEPLPEGFSVRRIEVDVADSAGRRPQLQLWLVNLDEGVAFDPATDRLHPVHHPNNERGNGRPVPARVPVDLEANRPTGEQFPFPVETLFFYASCPEAGGAPCVYLRDNEEGLCERFSATDRMIFDGQISEACFPTCDPC